MWPKVDVYSSCLENAVKSFIQYQPYYESPKKSAIELYPNVQVHPKSNSIVNLILRLAVGDRFPVMRQ